jgi:ABC-type multidrug transport system fused ATPase/permease subunit
MSAVVAFSVPPLRPPPGAGKSSLTVAMLRLADELGGRILIDGIDHTSMALGELRGRLALIPQEATMFQGDIRLNLDPLGHFSAGAVESFCCGSFCPG